jgi:hypothetical protein
VCVCVCARARVLGPLDITCTQSSLNIHRNVNRSSFVCMLRAPNTVELVWVVRNASEIDLLSLIQLPQSSDNTLKIVTNIYVTSEEKDFPPNVKSVNSGI